MELVFGKLRSNKQLNRFTPRGKTKKETVPRHDKQCLQK